ncbi:conserved hypothetical protein [Cupriavidus taiwanensis]|nr:conserved hypothetical protein [Cupriavidus taiwanensis]SPA57308.1 conserved protein of unknown function [Cupriavidus taiwanensis]
MTAATEVTTAMTANTERAAAIRWIQAEMTDYGLDHGGAGSGGVLRSAAPSHRRRPHPRHRRWSATATPRGRVGAEGDMPDCLRRTVNMAQRFI